MTGRLQAMGMVLGELAESRWLMLVLALAVAVTIVGLCVTDNPDLAEKQPSAQPEESADE